MSSLTSRRIGSAVTYNTGDTDSTTAELDNHADTVAVGKHAFIAAYTEQTVTVQPFSSNLSSLKQVPIVTAAIAYDCPTTYNTYILFFH